MPVGSLSGCELYLHQSQRTHSEALFELGYAKLMLPMEPTLTGIRSQALMVTSAARLPLTYPTDLPRYPMLCDEYIRAHKV